jgi:hypothetical protein
MKRLKLTFLPLRLPTLRILRRLALLCPAALSLVFCLLANHAEAAVTTWDPQGTTTTPQSGGFYTGNLSQTWENSEWDTANETGTATRVKWVENTAALFAVHSGTGTPAFTVTMNANHTVAGMYNGPLTPNPCSVTIQGTGTMILGPNNLNEFDITSDTSDPGSVTIKNVIAGDNTAPIALEGGGNVYFNAANTYSGYTTLGYSGASYYGIANFNNSASFGTGSLIISNTSSSIAALAVEGASAVTIPNPVTVGMGPTYNPRLNIVANPAPNGVTFSGNWTLNGANAVLGVYDPYAAGNMVTISGAIADGSSAGGLLMFNSGILVLSGANTFTGPITIGDGNYAPGTLEIGGTGTLGNTGLGVGSYAGYIYITNQHAPFPAAAGTFLYASSATQTLSGTIAGGGNLTQTAGTLILTGVAAYTGTTTVGPGTFVLGVSGGGGIGNVVNPSAVTVNSGGTLSIASTDVSLAGYTTINGTLEMVNGLASGEITVNDNVTLSGTTILEISLDPTYSGFDLMDQFVAVPQSHGFVFIVGGNLTVVRVTLYLYPGSFYAGEAFYFFGAPLAAGSGFTSFTLPDLGPGLAWDTSGLEPGFASSENPGALVVGCDGSLSVSVGAPPAICAGNSATLTATPSGGTGGYSYLWSPGGQTTASITVSSSGTYSVTVTDSGGCAASSASTVLTVNPPLMASAGSAQSMAAGGSVAIGGSPTASGGSGSGYTYLWSPATGLNNATAANPRASPAATTTYTVTVTDGNGCSSAPSSVTVTVTAPPAAPNVTDVVQNPDGSISLTATGAVGAVWSLRATNNLAAPLPWPNLTNGTITASPFTVADPPALIPDAQKYYYFTNTISP